MKSVIVSQMMNTPGTLSWGLVEKGEALFHGFGVDYEEFESGPGNFSVAIIEWPSGKVDLVRAEHIRFVVPNVKLRGTPMTRLEQSPCSGDTR